MCGKMSTHFGGKGENKLSNIYRFQLKFSCGYFFNHIVTSQRNHAFRKTDFVKLQEIGDEKST
jgi:hypothetical protein